ncbi:hypothetical protein KKF81_00140 [Candidatus Micrarchaeota archaeon]|nr:hypothetical protein [Candidatus Micrarchaeota archaeon]MBU1165326.1 hypothetical protein [Candidatus Micrarchaeota archaeon]MBU1886768.1 hypothetical protein [Candidatus Micrarchaeota archaeon]
MSAELETLLNEMKDNGIGGAVLKNDGTTVFTTIALNDVSSGLLASVVNVSDAMHKKMEDTQKEMEVSFGGLILVMVPMKNHIFCGMVKSRDEKKIVLEYAKKAVNFI